MRRVRNASLFFLSAVAFALSLLAAAQVCVMILDQAYLQTREERIDQVMRKELETEANSVFSLYQEGYEPWSPEEAGYRYEILDEENEVVDGNYTGQPDLIHMSYPVSELAGYTISSEQPAGISSVVIHLPAEPAGANRLDGIYRWTAAMWDLRYTLIALSVILGLACVAMTAAVLHTDKSASLSRRVPPDILCGIGLLACAVTAVPLQANMVRAGMEGYGLTPWVQHLASLPFAAAVYAALFVIACGLSVMARDGFANSLAAWMLRQLNTLWRTAVLLFLGLGALLFSVWYFYRHYLYSLPLRYILIIVTSVYLLFSACIMMHVRAFLQLKQTVGRISAGGEFRQENTRCIPRSWREVSGNLESIGNAMKRAVYEQTRSERLRSELITNVSHDIKTPLTSIISYVDLLKKEPSPPGRYGEYLAVLDRQSQRLKKLIEDLLEASKASSGNVAVSLIPCQLGIFLPQIAGEFEERLAQKNITAVLNIPEQPAVIMADGRHLWRVFDNLLGNIVKYGMPGTRAYLTLQTDARNAVVSVTNVSKQMLNIDGSELTERFVRGDISRSTEGSGLGLSIARSLTEIQGGKLDIVIDGDLFKAALTFPLLQPAEGAR